MKGRNKPIVKAGAVHHVYQNTLNGHLIFYSVKDYLILFSIICTIARRYDVKILGICMMPDHIHLLVQVNSRERLSAFVRDYTSLFTYKYNGHYHLSGPLFNTPFGCAPKLMHKKIRTAIAYLYNNPVEGHLAPKVENNRWNFLAYAVDKYPFSEKLRIDRSRWEMRKALYSVKAFRKEDRWLEYQILKRITANLSRCELQQFTDYVIRQYNVIDYIAVIAYYGSYDKMVMALNSNTGSEYDMTEDTFAKDYRIYQTMIFELCRTKGYQTMEKVLDLPLQERARLRNSLMRSTGAAEKEVAKLLRL